MVYYQVAVATLLCSTIAEKKKREEKEEPFYPPENNPSPKKIKDSDYNYTSST